MYHDHLIMFLPITANMPNTRSDKGKLSAITLSDSERIKVYTHILALLYRNLLFRILL